MTDEESLEFLARFEELLGASGWRTICSPGALVEQWRNFVNDCTVGYVDNIYEYENDRSVRDVLARTLLDPSLNRFEAAHVHRAEIDSIDRVFRELCRTDVEMSDASRPWWHRCVPRTAGGELADDLARLYDIAPRPDACRRDTTDYRRWWRDELEGVDCQGLSDTEIEQVALDQGVELPEAYAGFLAVAGRRCGDLWIGTTAFYPAILGLRDDATELLTEDEADWTLADTDVVIAMHQGYTFLYLSGREPDPAVHRYVEGEERSERIFERFSSLILTSVGDS